MEQKSYFVFKQNPTLDVIDGIPQRDEKQCLAVLSPLTLFIFNSHSCWSFFFPLHFRLKLPVCARRRNTAMRQGLERDAEWFLCKQAEPALWFGLLVKQHCSVIMSTKCLRQMTTSLNITRFCTHCSLMIIFVIHTNVSFPFHKC